VALRRRSHPWTEALLDRLQSGQEVLVPAHWPPEVANALLIARRRRRITTEQISEFIEDLAALNIRLEPPKGPEQWPTILVLAEKHRLKAYDAAYLELVLPLGCRSPRSTTICEKRHRPRALRSWSRHERAPFDHCWTRNGFEPRPPGPRPLPSASRLLSPVSFFVLHLLTPIVLSRCFFHCPIPALMLYVVVQSFKPRAVRPLMMTACGREAVSI